MDPEITAEDEPSDEPQPVADDSDLGESDSDIDGEEPLRSPVHATADTASEQRSVSVNGAATYGFSPRPSTGVAVTNQRAFRLAELRGSVDGRVHARLRRELIAKVYRRPTAVRLARHEARSLPADDTVLVLLRPSGSVIGVYAAGTGRRAPSGVARRAGRMLRELMPELFPKKRRTSISPRKKRTSRRPPKSRGRRTSRASRRRRGGGRR